MSGKRQSNDILDVKHAAVTSHVTSAIIELPFPGEVLGGVRVSEELTSGGIRDERVWSPYASLD